jgi:hypothetical protein
VDVASYIFGFLAKFVFDVVKKAAVPASSVVLRHNPRTSHSYVFGSEGKSYPRVLWLRPPSEVSIVAENSLQ